MSERLSQAMWLWFVSCSREYIKTPSEKNYHQWAGLAQSGGYRLETTHSLPQFLRLTVVKFKGPKKISDGWSGGRVQV